MNKALPDSLTCENVCIGEAASTLWRRRTKFMLNGNVLTLEELLGETTSNQVYGNIYEELKKNRVFRSRAHHQIIELLCDKVKPPKKLNYYINRTLSCRLELDPEIFTSSKEHCFLFTGIEKMKLAEVANAAIEYSGDPLRDENVRFIILEDEEDYESICKETTKPVHVIRHEDEKYFWVKSSKGLDFVREFLEEEVHEVSEVTFVSSVMSLPSSSSICISDSPGMGKTWLLANLARSIRDKESNGIILFIVLQEFVHQISSKSSPMETIAEFSTNSPVTKLVLMEMLKMESRTIYLFLDGYDEIYDRLDVVDSFIEQVQELDNVKLIVTSRPHLQESMERAVGQFSYEILPFDKSNQVEFLETYWTNHEEHPAKKSDNLKTFVEICLKALQSNLTDQENEIAGIPLQCMMLAEVYANDAAVASKRVVLHGSVKPISIFEMYKKLIDFKFSRIPRRGVWDKILGIFNHNSEQTYLHAHCYEAIALLIPGLIKNFKVILKARKKVDETTLYYIGLLERGSYRSRFIHRTFAEYLLAEFVVKNLSENKACMDLLFGEILQTKEGRRYFYGDDSYDLRYPVLAYFVNMHLGELARHQSVEKLVLVQCKMDVNDLCKSAVFAARNDLEWIFDYVSKVLSQYEIPDSTRDKFFMDLPHQIVGGLQKYKMVEKLLQFTRYKFNLGLTDHIIKEYKVCEKDQKHHWRIPDCTPVHMAVFKANYNVIANLLENYAEEIRKLKGLPHICVFNSGAKHLSDDSDELAILKLLIRFNPSWLEERDPRQCTPLLQFNVHFYLLNTLMELGADINAYSNYAGTVLHRIADNSKSSYKTILRWALENGFSLVNQKDRKGRTPIMYALESLEVLSKEGPRIFHDAGADFSIIDNDGNTVLFYAIQYWYYWEKRNDRREHLRDLNSGWLNENDQGQEQENLMFSEYFESTRIISRRQDMNRLLQLLSELVHYGANINAYTKEFGTFLHANVEMSMSEYADILRWAIQNGFKEINRSDRFMVSPLIHAIKMAGSVDDELAEVFGIFIDAVDDDEANDIGFSAILYALCFLHNISFIYQIPNFDEYIEGVTGDGSIEDRLLMIDVHVELYPDWLSILNVDGCVAMLQRVIDLRILQRLVKHGVDINAYSSEYGTLLHMSTDRNSYQDLVRWAFSNGFKLVNDKNSSNSTPLMHAVVTYETLEEYVLKLFYDAGADFNAKDNRGDTVYDYACQNDYDLYQLLFKVAYPLTNPFLTQ